MLPLENKCEEERAMVNIQRFRFYQRITTTKPTCTGKRRQVTGCVQGRGGIYLVAGGTVARQPQQQQWLFQRPQGGPE